MPHHTNILIAGAGCAGLSLAVHLLQSGIHTQKITIIEPRHTYQRDKTWCYWNTESHAFSHQASHVWNTWRVHQGETSIQRSGRLQYQHLAADDFYRAALEFITHHEQIEFLQGVEVFSTWEEEEKVWVNTTNGLFEADWVFDSRPPREALQPKQTCDGDVHILQHFLGVHVCFDNPCLDDSSVDLMDFRVDQGRGPRFMYVLPYNDREALIENTYISAEPLSEELHDQQLKEYIEARWPGQTYRIQYKETGVLPMQTAPIADTTTKRVIPIGLRGGMSKPSTGYAFLAIQRQSKDLATQMSKGWKPRYHSPRNAWVTFLDRVFLCYIQNHPTEFPKLMTKLFERVPSDALVRFLSECGSWHDYARVIWAMPKLSFVREMFRSYRVWTRYKKRLPLPSQQRSLT